MIGVVFNRALQEYKGNFAVAVSFGILLVFIVLFVFFVQFFVSSGTAFLSFNANAVAVIGLIIGIIFLYAFSFFVSVIIYSVRQGVQSFSIDTYWNARMRQASTKIFGFYLVLAVLLYVLFFLGLNFGFAEIALLIGFVISSALMFVPQSIVLDESSVRAALAQSTGFWVHNFVTSLAILIIGCVLLFIVVGIEFLLELANLPGIIFSLIVTLVVLVPFTEQMKSYAFVLKYALIRPSELQLARVKHHEHKKPAGVRLHEKPKHGAKL